MSRPEFHLLMLEAPARPERRAARRIPFDAPALCVAAGVSFEGRVLNLSREGLYLAAACPPEVGEEVEVSFAVWGLEVRATAEVVHVSRGAGAGVRFLLLAEEDRRLIEEVVEAHLRRQLPDAKTGERRAD